MIEPGPDLLVRGAQESEHAVDLVNLALALEQRVAAEELGHDAPQRPAVHPVPYSRWPSSSSGARYHSVTTMCVYARNGIAVVPREPEIANLELPAIVHQHVARLQVAVQHPVIVQVAHPGEELSRQAFHLRRRKRRGHRLHQSLQIVLRELHHHVHRVQRIPHHHLAHVHHVGVVHGEQDVRLAERGHGETLSLLLHLHLLQRAHFAPVFLLRARNTTP